MIPPVNPEEDARVLVATVVIVVLAYMGLCIILNYLGF